jgi:hypothetical protein
LLRFDEALSIAGRSLSKNGVALKKMDARIKSGHGEGCRSAPPYRFSGLRRRPRPGLAFFILRRNWCSFVGPSSGWPKSLAQVQRHTQITARILIAVLEENFRCRLNPM